MDSSVSPMDNPQTLPIRRGQLLGLESSGPAIAKSASGEIPTIASAGTQEAAPAVDPGLCPKCTAKLVNPEALGWCPKCGYCRTLEADQAAAKLATVAPPAKSALNQFGEYGELISRIPAWGWGVAGGACTIVALSMIANRLLPQEDSLARALISILTIVISIVTIMSVNLWSLFTLAPTDENLGPKDVFLFFGLWSRICGKLPLMRRQFSILVCCLVSFVCACFIVGGLEYWWDLYKPKKLAKTELLAAVNALADGAKPNDRSLTESVEDFGKKGDLKAKVAELKKKIIAAPRQQTTQTVVIGYLLNEDNQLDGLVVAALLNDRIRFAGIVRKGINPKDGNELMTALKPLVQPNSYIPGLAVKATWVKPSILCEISHEDFDENQHFIAPLFKGLLSDDR